MKRWMVILVLVLGIFLLGGFTTAWAEEDRSLELPTIDESWQLESLSPPETPALQIKGSLLYWQQWSGGTTATMQDLWLQFPKESGYSSIELLLWDLPKTTDLEVCLWPQESNFKIGPGFYSSSSGANWLTFNCWTRQEFGPGFLMFFAQAEKGLSGPVLSPNKLQINYLNYQFRFGESVSFGPDSALKFVDDKSPVCMIGGIIQVKSGDWLLRYRYLCRETASPTNQIWLFKSFRF